MSKRIDQHYTHITKGAMVRSRYKWYTEAGTTSKFFLNLEKVKYSNKTMKFLIAKDSTIICDHKKILLEQYKFYKKLYTVDPQVYFQYTNTSDVKLSEYERNSLEHKLTISEIANAIKSIPNDRCCGLDGLPVEIYKVFFTKIKSFLHKAILLAIDAKGHLHLSSHRGILALIPKKGKLSQYLENWRPLTLMNTDHKVLAKLLAIRIKPLMEKLVSDNQTGYMKGRFIGSNVCRIMDLLHYVESKDMECLLFSLDFRKCFDTIEFSAVKGTLEYFNFGPYFISMVFTLYNSFQSTIMHNGFCTKYFEPTRTIQQGCTISGYFFILTAEILAINLRKNPKIKGIHIDEADVEELVLQYVDDMYLGLMYDEESLKEVIHELDDFYLNTGLTVNYQKSVIYRVGKLKGSYKKLNLGVDFKWNDIDINILGVTLDENSFQQSYSQIIDKMASVTGLWKQ